MSIREVYVKIGTETENKIPKEFTEFKDFWNAMKNDEGYVFMYLDEKNQIVQ